MKHKRLGFTLVEMMVVLVIVAILVAIIIPLTAAAKAKASDRACVSNLKQIGLAVKLYSDDNEGFAPPYLTHGRGTIPANAEAWRDSLLMYTKSKEVFFCPRDQVRGSNPAQFGSWDSTFTSYKTPGYAVGQDVFGPNNSFRLNVDQAAQSAAEQTKGEETYPYLCDTPFTGPLRKEITVHHDQSNYLWLFEKVLTLKTEE